MAYTGPKVIMDEERTVRKIALRPEQIRPDLFDHDKRIVLDVAGEVFHALIPTASIFEENGIRFVPGEQIGRVADKLIIVLPPSNEGTPYLYIREEDLLPLLVP